MEGKKYKEIQLKSFKESPVIGEKELREPKSGEVRVKVLRATAHPSDLMFIRGLYGANIPSNFPITPGFEGSGIIDSVGEGIPKDLVGKYCSIGAILPSKPNQSFTGVWAQYYYTKPAGLIVYDKEVDLNTACFASANPLTAYGFLDIARESKAKAVIQNGAFSALGKMFLKLCIKNNLPVINIIRKEEQVKLLHDMGAKYVVNSSDKDYEKKLKAMIKELNPTVAFDCVGGNATYELFKLLPLNSRLIHFGNLVLKKLNGFDTSDFIFLNKKIEGFWLNYWLASLSKSKRQEIFSSLKKDIEENSEFIRTEINKEVDMNDFVGSLVEYATNMSKGKIVMKPNF